MSLLTTPNSCIELYDTCLKEISGVPITRRQAEVMACVLHNRGDKKIAAILGIEPRTASTHIRDIFNKFGYNSREQIIDAVEKSGKLKYIKQYYYHLLIQSYFEQTLRKIATTLEQRKVICILNYEYADIIEQQKLLLQIAEDLKLTRINVVHNKNNNSKDFTIKNDTQVIDLNIITAIKLGLQMPSSNTLNKQDQNTSSDRILLLFNSSNKIDSTKVMDTTISQKNAINYIDFTDTNNYYLAFFQLIHKMYNIPPFSDSIQHLIQDYRNYYNAITNADNSVSSDKTVHINFIIRVLNKYILSSRYKIVVFAGIVVITCIALSVYVTHNSAITQLEQSNCTKKQQLKEIERTIYSLAENFSANNISLQDKNNNVSHIKDVKELIHKVQNNSFFITNFSFDVLINYAYIVNAYANYQLIDTHDWQSARKFLKYIQQTIIQHTVSHNQILEIANNNVVNQNKNFSTHVGVDLVKIYARILYTLGRTYIYENNVYEGKEYFELARQLGQKFTLFEAVLSIRNGITIIIEKEAYACIVSQRYDQAEQKLIDLINIYTELKYDNNIYILDYSPMHNSPKKIIPQEDTFHKIWCQEKILKYYNKLLSITSDLTKQQEYLLEIEKGYLLLLSQISVFVAGKKEQNFRKIASIYNNLGDTLLILYDKNIFMSEDFRDKMVKILFIPRVDELKTIEYIYGLSDLISVFRDYTKADACDGLIRVKKRQLNQIYNGQNKQLLHDIKELAKKRDLINQQLHRNVQYEK